jgi:hypothetical protein
MTVIVHKLPQLGNVRLTNLNSLDLDQIVVLRRTQTGPEQLNRPLNQGP